MERKVESSVRLEAEAGAVFDRLTDYANLTGLLPGVESARVLAREGDVAVLEIRAPELGAPKLVLELVHSPPDSIFFTRVDRYRGEGTSGSLQVSGTGRETDLQISLHPGADFAGSRARKRLRQSLDTVLEAVRRALRGTDLESDRDGGRRKIPEITRRGDSMVVWHRGRVFELQRRTEDG